MWFQLIFQRQKICFIYTEFILYWIQWLYGYNNSKFKYHFDIWSYISLVNIIRTIGYMKYNMKDRGWTTLSILCLNGLFWCQVTFSRQDVSNEIKHCIRLAIFMCIFVANSSQLHSKVIYLIEHQTNFYDRNPLRRDLNI